MTLTAAIAIVTRNGASRQATITISSPATTASAIQPITPTGPGGAITSSPVAAASGTGASSRA